MPFLLADPTDHHGRVSFRASEGLYHEAYVKNFNRARDESRAKLPVS